MLDTDILSEFLRGNHKVIAKVDEHLKSLALLILASSHIMKFSTAYYLKTLENS